jgi:hypothetical protein
VWRLIRKLKIDGLYHPAIPLLDIDVKEYKSTYKKTPAHPCLSQHYSQYPHCGISLIAQQPMNGYRKYGIYTQEFYSLIKENESMLFAGEWMNADHHVEQDTSHS